jgi:hypothetical protein
MSKEQNSTSNDQNKKLSVDDIKAIKDAKNKSKNSTEPVKKC